MTETRPLRLNLPPQRELPILLAASSAESIRIAGELCDGWLPFLFPRDRLADGITLLKEGAARAGKSAQSLQVCPAIPTVVTEDAATAREGAAWFVAFYLLVMGPLYRQLLMRLGFDQAVAAVQAANADGKPAIVPPEAEVLLEQLTIYGTPEQAQRQLAQWYAAGANMPVLVLRPNLSANEADFVLQTFRSQPGTNS
jgi:alkanesulfonate monooxygenase SsuD/methylene tetrahydromethanopterin reductase-like flavin-dependent oxidoreductase (luciferase family)